MTEWLSMRSTAGVLAALALGIAAPAAGARPIETGPGGSDAASFWPQTSTSTVQAHANLNHPGGGITGLEYVALGTGAASVVLIGAGGLAAGRRRRQRAAVRPTVAA
jgi:hypothetical protein